MRHEKINGSNGQFIEEGRKNLDAYQGHIKNGLPNGF
jgi:hypothetical protein